MFHQDMETSVLHAVQVEEDVMAKIKGEILKKSVSARENLVNLKITMDKNKQIRAGEMTQRLCTGGSSRGPEFNSLQPHAGSQPCVM